MRFRIDLKIFIFIIIFCLTKQIEVYAIMMIFAVIHELGHLAAGLILKMKPEKIEIIPVGLAISFKIDVNDYNHKIEKANFLEVKKIIIALAGPITNLIIIFITGLFKLDLITKLIIYYTNLLILLFNLLPIYPLDGGRILKGILHITMGRKKAEKYSNIISIIMAILLSILSGIIIFKEKNLAILFVLIYVWLLVLQENKRYQKRKKYIKTIENYKDS